MNNKVTALITSLLFAVPFVNTANTVYAADSDNLFKINYNYTDNKLTASLFIDGDVCVAGFDAVLKYDANKYSFEETSDKLRGVMVNNSINKVGKKGEVAVSMNQTKDNLTSPAKFANIEFNCSEVPQVSDFSFIVNDLYQLDENKDILSDGYQIQEKWDGLPMAYFAGNSANNNFGFTIKENKAEKNVEAVFSVKGNVNFYAAMGSLIFDSKGLGTPKVTAFTDETVVSEYIESTKSVKFALSNATGKNFTKSTDFVKCVFPIIDDDYTLSCSADIKMITDDKFKVVSYTILKDGEESQEITNAAGDVNGDGSIDLKDVVLIRRYIAGGWNVTIDKTAADVNNDEAVNLKDVVMLRRYIAGGWGVTLI